MKITKKQLDEKIERRLKMKMNEADNTLSFKEVMNKVSKFTGIPYNKLNLKKNSGGSFRGSDENYKADTTNEFNTGLWKGLCKKAEVEVGFWYPNDKGLGMIIIDYDWNYTSGGHNGTTAQRLYIKNGKISKDY